MKKISGWIIFWSVVLISNIILAYIYKGEYDSYTLALNKKANEVPRASDAEIMALFIFQMNSRSLRDIATSAIGFITIIIFILYRHAPSN